MDFVPAALRKTVYPVGRLDLHSSGLILMLNDGALAHRLTHPAWHVPKVYRVTTARVISDSNLALLRTGVKLEEGITAPCKVERDPTSAVRLMMTLYEGRKRQIRNMISAVEGDVSALHRLSIGPLQLGDLPTGQIRKLTAQELAALRKAVGLEP
jgi:pseudouridine synthase